MSYKVVIASDSFKGSLSSARCIELAQALAPAHVEVCGIEVADGGEGTAAAIQAALGGEQVQVSVHDPLRRPIEASYLRFSETSAFIDTAAASGITLLDRSELDPLRASSLGTGELIRHALTAGCTDIYLGLGGSATNDLGLGILEGLGAQLKDASGDTLTGCGASLAQLDAIDLAPVTELLADAHITALCDVNNPLLGEHGATATFGPQKGVTNVAELDHAMSQAATVMERVCGREIRSVAGAGAAGGIGALCVALGAHLKSGIQTVLDLVHFDDVLTGADAVLTGEGAMDAQTAHGKVVAGIAGRCAAAGIPCIALVGSCDPRLDVDTIPGLTAVFSVVPGPCTLDQALAQAERNYRHALANVLRLICP